MTRLARDSEFAVEVRTTEPWLVAAVSPATFAGGRRAGRRHSRTYTLYVYSTSALSLALIGITHIGSACGLAFLRPFMS